MSDYSRRPVDALLRGPLLHAREGRLVLAAAAAYGLAAIGFAWLGWPLPAGKTRAAVVTACAAWPLVSFVFFVRECAPDFRSTWWRTALVATGSFAPLAWTAWTILGL